MIKAFVTDDTIFMIYCPVNVITSQEKGYGLKVCDLDIPEMDLCVHQAVCFTQSRDYFTVIIAVLSRCIRKDDESTIISCPTTCTRDKS